MIFGSDSHLTRNSILHGILIQLKKSSNSEIVSLFCLKELDIMRGYIMKMQKMYKEIL